MTARTPAIAVLCPMRDDLKDAESSEQSAGVTRSPEEAYSAGLWVPPRIEELADRAELRFCVAGSLAEALPGAEALFLWDFFSPAVRDAWGQADRLAWIHVAAAGVDSLMFDDLAASAVTVTNAQGIFDRPIAEFVLGAIFSCAKDFAGSQEYKRQRTWAHRETERVQGTHALVIGTGAIGRETARLLRAVGMSVRGVGRRARSEDPDFGTVVDSAELAQHIGWADHVVNAAPLTSQTRGLIDAEVLGTMKPGAHLVNIGRGESVEETSLIQALRHGPLGFASLDVFEEEPLPQASPLWDMDNVLISAHMSGDVLGWRDALADQFIDNALRWLDDRPLENVVDTAKGYVPRT